MDFRPPILCPRTASIRGFVRGLSTVLALGLTPCLALAESSPVQRSDGSAAVPSLDALATAPQFGNARLSPDGRHIAVLRIDAAGNSLLILDAESMAPANELKFSGRQNVIDFFWANNEMLVVSRGTPLDGFGRPRMTGELYAVSLHGEKRRYLFGHKADRTSRNRGRDADRAIGWVLDTLPDDPSSILVAAVDWSEDVTIDFHPRIYRIDVYSGARSEIAKVPMRSPRITVDGQGQVRFASGWDDDNKPATLRFDPDAGSWSRVDLALAELGSFEPLGFAEGDNAVFASISERGEPGCLYRVDLADYHRQKLTCDPDAEPSFMVPSSKPGRPMAIAFDAGIPRLHLLEPASDDAAMYRALSEQLAPEFVQIIDFSRDGRRLLFSAYGDRWPGRVFLFDRDAQRARPVYSRQPQIDPAGLVSTLAYAFDARDGTRLHGLITLPGGGSVGNLPMVVMPHGGPHGVSDRWDYDAAVQVLATRGYAVLQVDFRGSGGYGQAFLRKGFRQWGHAIQDDIVDATRWAVDNGVADPGRICILGASFGAYSALMSAIRAPDLFRCAVGYAGVYDLESMFRRGDIRRTEAGRRYLDLVLGHDEAELAAQSPVAQIERLAAPVLIVHGGADVRAPLAHANKLRQALERHDKPHEWFIVDNEAHGFFRSQNRKRYYERVLAFLDRHIGREATTR